MDMIIKEPTAKRRRLCSAHMNDSEKRNRVVKHGPYICEARIGHIFHSGKLIGFASLFQVAILPYRKYKDK